MSFEATSFRPLARGGWGGRAASHFRGELARGKAALGLPVKDPQVLGPSWRGQIGTVVYRSAGVTVNYAISGVTRDSVGAALGNCRVELFVTALDVSIAETVSDASGNFRFANPGTGPFYIVAYKAGGADVAGTTVNTLVAT